MESDRCRGHANAVAIKREDSDGDELFRQSRDVATRATRTLLQNDRRTPHQRPKTLCEDALGQSLSSAWSERSEVAGFQDGFTQGCGRIHPSDDFLGMGGSWPFDEVEPSERNRGNNNAFAGVPAYLYDSSSESTGHSGLGKDTTAIAHGNTFQLETVHSMNVSMFSSIPFEQAGSRASEMNYLDQGADSMTINGHTPITVATTQAIKIEPTNFTTPTFEPPQEHARGLHLLAPGKIVSMPSRRLPEIAPTLKPEDREDSKKSVYTGGQVPDPLPNIPPFVSGPPAVLGPGSVFEESLISSLTSVGLDNPPSGAPKQILHGYYGKMEAKTQISKDDYITWPDGGRDHDRRFTCIFLCPLTGERYPSCAYGQTDSYEVRVDHETDARVVWYKQKMAAEHAAAARACDCICLRYGSPVRLGNDPPYLKEGDIIIPSIPAETKQRI
jgi:hypothetical protein